MPTLTDETARYTPSGRLIDRTIEPVAAEVTRLSNQSGAQGKDQSLLTSAATINYSYDSSGNMTNAVMTRGGLVAQSWTLAYDEDNRTSTIVWTTNGTSRTVLNRFDALGRRVARTLDGTETRYVLDLGGGMERILCDLEPSGTITAWYIHGPDLCYKVDAAGAVTCYHADAQANVIALTGSGGTNLAQYAYSPYGRVLASTNLQPSAFSPQPFLFVGSQGVMEELPGLYFMRARYYSADATVFLSTDPVKKIGPTWKPAGYRYASANPFSFLDPDGEVIVEAVVVTVVVYVAFRIGWEIGEGIAEYFTNPLDKASKEAQRQIEQAQKSTPITGKCVGALEVAPHGKQNAYSMSNYPQQDPRQNPMPTRAPAAAEVAEASNTQTEQSPVSPSSGKSGGGGSGGGGSKSPYGANVKYDSYGNAYYQKGRTKDYETASWQARASHLKTKQAAKKKTSSRKK